MSAKEDLQLLSRDLNDKGLLIEAGFVSLRMAAYKRDVPEAQLRELRMAFFAGAQHLFASILSILDPGAEPTDKDMQRMAAIDQELKRFIHDFELHHLPTAGNS